MIGKVFNRWTVIDTAPNTSSGKRWLCRCVCGVMKARVASRRDAQS